MPKFLIIYNSDKPAGEVVAESSPEQVKAGMDSWIAWKNEIDKRVKFEWGLPLQAVGRVTASGAGASSNKASGYSMMEGDEDEIIELLKSHPHLKRSVGGTIDVFEMLPMEGM